MPNVTSRYTITSFNAAYRIGYADIHFSKIENRWGIYFYSFDVKIIALRHELRILFPTKWSHSRFVDIGNEHRISDVAALYRSDI